MDLEINNIEHTDSKMVIQGLPKKIHYGRQRIILDYEKAKKQQEDEIEHTRVQYMTDVDSIFFNMFGENTNSKTIKEMVNSDVNKNLEK
mgnify:CR=1 FL=1